MSDGADVPPRGHLAPYLVGDFSELGRRGYQVVRGAVENPDDLRSAIDSDVQALRAELGGHLPTPLLQQYGAGHWCSAWRARIATIPVWRALYGTDKLVSSWDGLSCVLPSEQRELLRTTVNEFGEPNWVHRDQRRSNTSLADTIQGVLALSDGSGGEYTTVLFTPKRGSAQALVDAYDVRFCQRKTRSGRVAPRPCDDDDFYQFSDEELAFWRERAHFVRPTLQKGDLLLWCSAMPHAAAPSTDLANDDHRLHTRVAAFVAMFPKSLIQPHHLSHRRQLAKRRLTSSHNVLQPMLFPFSCGADAQKNEDAFRCDPATDAIRRSLVG